MREALESSCGDYEFIIIDKNNSTNSVSLKMVFYSFFLIKEVFFDERFVDGVQ